MLNALRQNLSPRAHPIRFAILMVLGGMAAGIVIDRAILSDENAEDQRGAITDPAQKSEGNSPQGSATSDSGQGTDPDSETGDWIQCRNLVFEVSPNSECPEPSDEEILARAKEARGRIAQQIIDDFGIADENRKKEVRDCVAEGSTVVEPIIEDDTLTLVNPDPEEGESDKCHIDLDDSPEEDPLEGVDPEAFIGQFDTQKLLDALKTAGLQDVLGEEMATLHEARQEFAHAKDPTQKDLAACRLYYRFARLKEKSERLSEDQDNLMDENPDLDRFFGDRPDAQDGLLFQIALGKFLEAGGRDDEEACFAAMAEAPMCMPPVQE